LRRQWRKVKTLEEVVSIKNTDIAKHLSLPPVKLHCSMLAEDAIKAAVKDIKMKREIAAAKQTNVNPNITINVQEEGQTKLARATAGGGGGGGGI